jgi:anti-sigma factor RsiW
MTGKYSELLSPPQNFDTATLKRLPTEQSSPSERYLKDFKVDRHCLKAGAFEMNPTRQVLHHLGDALRKLYQPFIREDVTDRLRAAIERLDARSREPRLPNRIRAADRVI